MCAVYFELAMLWFLVVTPIHHCECQMDQLIPHAHPNPDISKKLNTKTLVGLYVGVSICCVSRKLMKVALPGIT